jgi:hypothetical protein
MTAAYLLFEVTRCNGTNSNGTAFGVGVLEFVFQCRNLDALQPPCSRDPAPPLLRAGSGPAQLRVCSPLLTHCGRAKTHRGPKSVYNSQPLPARTHPQTVVPVCLSMQGPMAAHSKNVYLTLAFASSFPSSHLSFLLSSLLPLQQDLLLSFLFTSAHAELCTL